jgi:two-component system CheB/CheR fusion protein
LQDVVELCLATRHRTEPVRLDAVNRIGRAIVCAVVCSPLDRLEGGVVLLMEEMRKKD